MDKVFWLDRWRRHDIGFHQPHVHEQLKRFWPTLNLEKDGAVFVPLAGKSRDMVWLAEQGYRILGVELSDIAIGEFFAELGLAPEKASTSDFGIYHAGPFTLFCGDVFGLTADVLKGTSAAYDRAALVALPPDMRPRYAKLLAQIVPQSALIFLISLDYPEHEISGPPFAVSHREIERLFGSTFEISLLEARDGLAASDNLKKRGVTKLEEAAYLLRRRT